MFSIIPDRGARGVPSSRASAHEPRGEGASEQRRGGIASGVTSFDRASANGVLAREENEENDNDQDEASVGGSAARVLGGDRVRRREPRREGVALAPFLSA